MTGYEPETCYRGWIDMQRSALIVEDNADILCRCCHNSKQTGPWHRIRRKVRRLLGGRRE